MVALRNNRANDKTGLLLFSKCRVTFPPCCARCGKGTPDTIDVKIGAGTPGLKPTVLLGHIGQAIEVVGELRAGSAKIPCCQSCRRAFVIGRSVSVAFLICAPVLLAIIVKYADHWPEWLMVLAGFIAFTMFIGALIPYIIGQGRSAPVQIWRGDDGFFYHFYSGVYSEWARRPAIGYVEVPDPNRSEKPGG